LGITLKIVWSENKEIEKLEKSIVKLQKEVKYSKINNLKNVKLLELKIDSLKTENKP